MSAIEITLDEPVVITTDSGEIYRATLDEGLVAISYQHHERWLRVGEGAWDGCCIVDCDADLGEDGFDLLNSAISAAIAD